jgi:hypothetical protein
LGLGSDLCLYKNKIRGTLNRTNWRIFILGLGSDLCLCENEIRGWFNRTNWTIFFLRLDSDFFLYKIKFGGGLRTNCILKRLEVY